jgi:hypothetical protein
VLFSNSLAAQTPTAEKVLADMIQALGGKAFLEVKDIHNSGRLFSFKRGELAGSDVFADYIKFPDMERTEFGTLRNKTIHVNRGNEGWILEGKDLKPQPAANVDDFLISFKTSFDYVTRFVLNQPRTTVQLTGSEIVDFKRADIVEVRDAAKNLIRFYIDRQTHLPVKMQVRRANKSVIQEEQYSNWHVFQGIATPLYVSRLTDNEKTMEIRLDNATYNSALAENLFNQPTPPK